MAGSRYVLTEFSASTEEKYIRDRIYELLSSGYKPIVAHIERYKCMKDIELVEYLVNKGAYMQVNADSVIGKNGHGVKKYCGKLLEDELVQFIGSDCHGANAVSQGSEMPMPMFQRSLGVRRQMRYLSIIRRKSWIMRSTVYHFKLLN